MSFIKMVLPEQNLHSKNFYGSAQKWKDVQKCQKSEKPFENYLFFLNLQDIRNSFTLSLLRKFNLFLFLI